MNILFEDGPERTSELYWSWFSKTLIAYVPNKGIRITTVGGTEMFLKPGDEGYEELEEATSEAPFWEEFVISESGAGPRYMISPLSVEEEVADFPGYLPALSPSQEGTPEEQLEAIQESLEEWDNFVAREMEWLEEDSNPFYY